MNDTELRLKDYTSIATSDCLRIKEALDNGKACLSTIKDEQDSMGFLFVDGEGNPLEDVYGSEQEIVMTIGNGEYYLVERDADGFICDFDSFYYELKEVDCGNE